MTSWVFWVVSIPTVAGLVWLLESDRRNWLHLAHWFDKMERNRRGL